MIRVKPDLAAMIAWVCKAKGTETATLMDKMLRPSIEASYVEHYQVIRVLKANADESAAEDGEQPGPPLPELKTLDPTTGQLVTLEELHSKPAPDPKKKPKK